MKMLLPFVAVMALAAAALMAVNVANLHFLFGVIIPYIAFAVFVGGFVYRIVKWASSPVPFRIPTTCGQEFSLPWVKQNKIENPSTAAGVIIRMALEIFLFRSLFRNIKAELRDGQKIVYGSDKWLWLAGLAFHWTFLVILVRHLRFFVGDVPMCIAALEHLDGFLQIGVPMLYITDGVILAAIGYLFIRRVLLPQIRYISLPADYFPLFLIAAVVISGILMRYITKVDVVGVKNFTMGLVTFNPVIPATLMQGNGAFFFLHVFLISALFAYFPFSKLMHMGGVFMSPTRNMINNSRMVRHVNPWNYPVHVHTYEEYENDFRAKMKDAGIPVEKE
ncbi:MAG: sulfate reduction electron transfer complex DsrMKJOP subunit DsrM [Nitrospirae bacterium]|nr:sulfate reduction electron transfer complex DsrMKJOP subunit DsrM [Nitrospirota bacterium]